MADKLAKYNVNVSNVEYTVDLATNFSDIFADSKAYEAADYFGTTTSDISDAVETAFVYKNSRVYAVPDRTLTIIKNTGVNTLTVNIPGLGDKTSTTTNISAGRSYTWVAAASTGYILDIDSGSGNFLTGNITVAPVASRISGTLSQGTLPTGVDSITCYRKAWDSNSYSTFTSGTIYYGDKFYWEAVASDGYNTPSVTYGSSSNAYTWTGAQGGAITSVSTSGLSAGTRITWSLAITMDDYVTKWRYKIDSGSWITKEDSYTVSGIDYASTVTVEGRGKEDAEGYTYGSYVGTGTFGSGAQSSDLSTTLSCTRTRITWSMAVTLDNYVTKWRYKIDSGSWSSDKSASDTISGIDYASKITVEGRGKEDADGYTYGSYVGTGTFGSGTQTSDLSTTLSCSRTRITWAMIVTMSDYVTSWRYKIGSGEWVNKSASYIIPLIDYASKITIECRSKEDAEGYNYGDYVGAGTFGSGAQSTDLSTTLSCTRTRITWSMDVALSDYVTKWRYKIDEGSWSSDKSAGDTISSIDYASTITIEGRGKEDDPAYNYGDYEGTGTFSYGSSSTVVSCTRTIKHCTYNMSVTPNYLAGGVSTSDSTLYPVSVLEDVEYNTPVYFYYKSNVPNTGMTTIYMPTGSYYIGRRDGYDYWRSGDSVVHQEGTYTYIMSFTSLGRSYEGYKTITTSTSGSSNDFSSIGKLQDTNFSLMITTSSYVPINGVSRSPSACYFITPGSGDVSIDFGGFIFKFKIVMGGYSSGKYNWYLKATQVTPGSITGSFSLNYILFK